MLAAALPAGADLAESLWRPDAEQGADAHGYCAGGYAGSEIVQLPADNQATPVTLTAGTLRSRVGATTTVSGGVVVRQGARRIAAEELTIDERSQRVRADSAVRVAEPGLHMLGQRAEVALRGEDARIEDVEFVLTDLALRGGAAMIDKRAGTLDLVGATFTRCPPKKDIWRMRATNMRIDRDSALATARHARLTLGKVPILYAPYMRFPVRDERASGFLFPNIGYDGEDGLDLTLPYYLNLAPHYDATLTPRLIANRGLGAEAEFRHLGARQRNEFGGAFLPADDNYNGEFSRPDFLAVGGAASAFAPADRWLLTSEHRGRFDQLRTLVDFAAVSDNDYFVDLGAEIAVASRVLLERRAEVQYANGGLFARLWTQGFQRLEPGPEPYRRLPEANVAYAGDLWGPLAWSVGAAWSYFQPGSSSAPGLASVAGERRHVEPRLRLNLAKPWGFANLSAGVRHTDYLLRDAPTAVDTSPDRNVRVASADGGLFLERDLRQGDWIQTLEPRLYYLYQSRARQEHLPLFDATRLTFSYRQLFRDNRFAGLDRFGDANQVAAGVTSRLLTAATGRELLSGSIGAIAYLDDRQVVLRGAPNADERQPTSALAGELRGRVGGVSLTSTVAWDSNDNEWDEASLGVSYRPAPRRIVNLAYRRRVATDTDQTDLSFHWPLAGNRFSAFGRWNHDWRYGQIIEAFAGFGYANCCLEVKLLWHETIDAPRNRLEPDLRTDGGPLLQIVFRGLAGFGTKVDARLQRGIKGYRSEEQW